MTPPGGFDRKSVCPWDPSRILWAYDNKGRAKWVTPETFERYRINQNRRTAERRREKISAGTFKKRTLTEHQRVLARRYKKNWKLRNPEVVRAQARKDAKKHSKRRREVNYLWRAKNRDRVLAWRRHHYKTNLRHRLSEIARNRVRIALKGIAKSAKTVDLIGCSIDTLKAHIESQFKPGMTWENYTNQGWHVDHIRPCASFDLSDPEQQKQCFHYTNLQPMWAAENLSKNSKWTPSSRLSRLPDTLGSGRTQQQKPSETSDTTMCLSAPSSNASLTD